MKNILVILFILISLISCNNNPNNPNNNFTTGPGNFSKLAGTYVSSILEDGTRLKITIKNDNSPLIINISGKDYEIDTSNVEESTEGKYSIRYSKDVYSEVIISISLLGESTIHFSQWGWSEDLLLRENYILIKENNLNIDSLINKVKNKEVKEIILATNATLEGETTARYIKELLSSYEDIKISRIAYGLPVGGDLLYADQMTLLKALEGRQEYK